MFIARGTAENRVMTDASGFDTRTFATKCSAYCVSYKLIAKGLNKYSSGWGAEN
jgi:hypothetical protein